MNTINLELADGARASKAFAIPASTKSRASSSATSANSTNPALRSASRSTAGPLSISGVAGPTPKRSVRGNATRSPPSTPAPRAPSPSAPTSSPTVANSISTPPSRSTGPSSPTNGKEQATVRMMLNHTVGVPIFRERVRAGGCTDFDYMAGLLAAQEPFWKPGARVAYHMISFGWTVGELVRRVSGMSLGAFFRKEVGDPLNLDFWIGAPEDIEARFAPVILFAPDPIPFPAALRSRDDEGHELASRRSPSSTPAASTRTRPPVIAPRSAAPAASATPARSLRCTRRWPAAAN
jgi:hypothetical protein